MATGAARLNRKNRQQGGKRKTNLTLTGLLMEGPIRTMFIAHFTCFYTLL